MSQTKPVRITETILRDAHCQRIEHWGTHCITTERRDVF